MSTYKRTTQDGFGEQSDKPTKADFHDEHDDIVRIAEPFAVFRERDAFDERTGSAYRRCLECGAEMTTGMVADSGFVHARDCPEASR